MAASSQLGEERLTPRFLTAADYAWLALLVEEYQRFVGRPRRELSTRLQEPLPFDSPDDARALACRILDRVFAAKVSAPVRPAQVRAALFTAATRCRRERSRDDLVRETSEGLGLAPAVLEECVVADWPLERRVVAGEVPPVAELCLRANLALVQGLLARSASVSLALWGAVRPVLRQASLRGLICTPVVVGPGAARLEISGPLSLFRRTLIYGRALGELVPHLAWCNRYHLAATVLLRERTVTLELQTGAPIMPARPPPRYDSAVEARFARAFARAFPEWDLVREPEPVAAGGSLIFPDFALQPRSRPAERWLLEIVGFWTPEYLERKLSHLRRAAIPRLVLCVNEQLNCAAADLPPSAEVVWYRRRIDPARVMEAIAGASRDAEPWRGVSWRS